jgi:hypothetical protein
MRPAVSALGWEDEADGVTHILTSTSSPSETANLITIHAGFDTARIILHEHGRGKLACKPAGARHKAVARVVSSETDQRDNAFFTVNHRRATIGNFPDRRVQHGCEDLLAVSPHHLLQHTFLHGAIAFDGGGRGSSY